MNTFNGNFSQLDNSIKCELKIDFIRLSTFSLDALLLEIGKKIYCQKSRVYQKNNNIYSKITKQKIIYNNNSYNMIIAESKKAVMPAIISIHDPSKELLQKLDYILLKAEVKYNINASEFTYDFYSNDEDIIYQFIKEFSYIKWRGDGLDLGYKTTHYINDIRKSKGKGGRVYRKEENGIKFVRLEILIKRNLLKNKDVHSINDFIERGQNLPNEYFCFKQLNWEKIRKKTQRLWDNSKRKRLNDFLAKHIFEGKLYELNKKLKKHLSQHKNEDFLKESVYWDYFVRCFGNSSFINGDYFTLSLDLMREEINKNETL